MSNRKYPEIIDLATLVAKSKSDKVSEDLRKDAEAVAVFHKVDWTQDTNDFSVFYPQYEDKPDELDKYVIPFLKRYNVLRDKVVSIERYLTRKVNELNLLEPQNEAQQDFFESIKFLKQVQFASDHYNALYHLLEWLQYDRRISLKDKIDFYFILNFEYSNDAQRWTDPLFIEIVQKAISKAIILGIDGDYLGGYNLSNIKKVGSDGTITYDASLTKAVKNYREKNTDKQNEFWRLTDLRFINQHFENFDLTSAGLKEFKRLVLEKKQSEKERTESFLY